MTRIEIDVNQHLVDYYNWIKYYSESEFLTNEFEMNDTRRDILRHWQMDDQKAGELMFKL